MNLPWKMSSQIKLEQLREFAAAQSNNRLLVISDRDVTERPFLYGEDYYISTLISELKKNHVLVDFGVLKGKKITLVGRSSVVPIAKIGDSYTSVILQNISPFHVLTAKIKSELRITMPVYFLKNKSISMFNNLKTRVGIFLWQCVVDEYLASSSIIGQNLARMGVFKSISVVPPVYSCPYCSRADNLRRREFSKAGLPSTINIVYVGSILQKRFSLEKTVTSLNRNAASNYRLTIFTMSQVEEQTYCEKNVHVTIARKMLSEKEKCEVLRNNHIFIAPAKGTTMEPSISVIEAEWHGNIIQRFD